MIRRFVSALALAAVVTTGAQAQFTDNFAFNPGAQKGATTQLQLTNWASFFGQFTVTTPSVVAQTGVLANTPFQVFCVDELNNIKNFANYQVWVSPLSGSLAHTRLGLASDPNAFTKYFKAANLASNMLTAPPGSAATKNATNDNLEYAIWTVMGTVPPAPGSALDPTNDYCASTTIVGCAGWDAANLSSGLGLSPNQWLVITAFDLSTNDFQEFIYNGPGRPFQTPVPEPGTMALLAVGLVGIAGSGLRRRKNKQ